MTRFDFSISHVPGTQLHTADALSRAPKAQVEDVTELEAYIDGIEAALPATRVQRHTGKRSDMCEGARDL